MKKRSVAEGKASIKVKGPRPERETVINFNEAEDTVYIWTASETTSRRLLKRLGREYPTKAAERHAEFRFPVKFITLPRQKVKTELTTEKTARRAALGARALQFIGRGRQKGHKQRGRRRDSIQLDTCRDNRVR